MIITLSLLRRMQRERDVTRKVVCPTCGATPGSDCISKTPGYLHRARRKLWIRERLG